uniref:DNA endonuclease activator Ctp1 C-terminal domain-containing protein n=1 Tax=Ditylenchus dipsaci TaxID=166011 RepID=A0A915D379_9BILA
MDKFLKHENESFNNSNSSAENLKSNEKEKQSQTSVFTSLIKQKLMPEESKANVNQVCFPSTNHCSFTGIEAVESKENLNLGNNELAICQPAEHLERKSTLIKAPKKEEAFVSMASTSNDKEQENERRNDIKRLRSTPIVQAAFESFTLKAVENSNDDFLLSDKENLISIIDVPLKTALKKVCSPSFQAECERAALDVFDKSKEISALKEKGGSVRNAEARVQLMHGHDCECCAPYYDALNLSPGERQRRINQVSRHRTFEPGVRMIPRTPPRYWDINFPSVEEQKRLGLLVETNSPLFKKKGPRRKLIKKRVSRSS